MSWSPRCWSTKMEKAKPGSSSILAVAAVVASLGACATQNPAPNSASTSAVITTGASASAAYTVPAATGSPEQQEIAAIVAANKAVIVFPDGSATLTDEANRKLDLAARLFRDANPVLMFASGYSNRTGEEYSNLMLSARRAEAIKRGLVARGIPANQLLIQAFGESVLANPSDPTGAENRRVVITWNLH